MGVRQRRPRENSSRDFPWCEQFVLEIPWPVVAGATCMKEMDSERCWTMLPLRSSSVIDRLVKSWCWTHQVHHVVRSPSVSLPSGQIKHWHSENLFVASLSNMDAADVEVSVAPTLHRHPILSTSCSVWSIRTRPRLIWTEERGVCSGNVHGRRSHIIEKKKRAPRNFTFSMHHFSANLLQFTGTVRSN